jgi:hypothetical protein
MSRANTILRGGLTTIRTVGGIFPADLLDAVLTGTDLSGLGADNFHLTGGLTPREAANRAWSVLRGAWATYRQSIDARPDGDPAVGLTRERWLLVLLRELGFRRVPTTPAGGLETNERSWPVSHLAEGALPVHLLGWHTDLDRRTPGMPGAAERPPHAMVQELLNRSEDYLWALLAAGDRLRMLRDSSTLVGPSYVEFDLEAMFDGEVFSDFTVLYLLCHQSRFEPIDPEIGMASCWLERWRTHAVETGARALGALRIGVHDAIGELGTGLLTHPANTALRADLDEGRIDAGDLQRAILRLVYRLLFCFVAEDRGLLLDPVAPPDARQRYLDWFSTARLRRTAARRRGDNHADLWQALTLVLDGLGKESGCPQLALPGLGGIFEDGPADITAGAQLSNRYLLAAVRHLCVTAPTTGGPRRMVDYRHLGAEELGGIYESLLEYVPRADPVTREFTLETLAGNDRKKTGAYYTPSSLTECLLDTALDPLLDRAEGEPDPEAALLALTVCDPACGSGHFLVAAARRIAGRLAATRADGAEPTVEDLAAAMHDVIARCIYGVDLNPMAAELAKVSLWLEGLRPGAPLSLLDAHIKVGNALLGTTPALLAAGIPDQAFAPIAGDDRKITSALKKRNKAEHGGARSLFDDTGISVPTGTLAAQVAAIDALPAARLADVHVAARRLRDLEDSPELRRARLVADAWCAAFILPKAAGQPELTQADLVRLSQTGPEGPKDIDSPLVAAIRDAQERYRFFHWHLEFPQIFGQISAASGDALTGWDGGFDCVLGNPPWERVKLQEQEWFATRLPAIVEAPNAVARKRLIAQLETDRPELYAEFLAARRQAEGESHFIRSGGRYPLSGRGDINTYAIFAENDRSLLGTTGRLGVILPTGIATDATTQYFFKDLVLARSIVSLFDFENSAPLFDNVHRSFKFCLLTLSGRATPVRQASFAFFAHHPEDLAREGTRFALTPEEITLLNPNTGTCPVFRTRRDAEITLAIYRRHPVLVRKDDPDGNPWGVSFTTMFHMSNDSHLFRTRQDLEADGWTLDGNVFHRGSATMLPLYEAKMIHHYDHRWATYTADGDVRDATLEEHQVPDFTVLPRYWVDARAVDAALAGRWNQDWLLGFRDITNTTNERTLIAGLVPRFGVGHKFPLLLPGCKGHVFGAMLSSFVLDFISRQKVGGISMAYFVIEQLPVLLPTIFAGKCPWDQRQQLQDWIEDRVDELLYTARDMASAATSIGDDGEPFVWDADRRAVLRAELDAAFFHIYGIDSRENVAYILSTFPIVNRKDPGLAGRLLGAYDALANAVRTGVAYVSPLKPAPGEGLRHSEPLRANREPSA